MGTKQVIATRGIPGSGKTTWVLSQMTERSARINNDELVASMFVGPRSTNRGELLHKMRLSQLRTLLGDDSIDTIYVDNTNLNTRTLNGLQAVALEFGATFIVDDRFFAISVEECIHRDSLRLEGVGSAVIKDMAKQASRLKPWVYPDYPVVEPYDNSDTSLPAAIIVDIDGTIAIKGDRSPYDYDRVGEDTVSPSMKFIVNAYLMLGVKVMFLSGRDGSCVDATAEWIEKHVISIPTSFPVQDLYLGMRNAGDKRPDWVVKHELFQERIAGKFHILAVFDDRDQMIHLYRRRLKLPTFQVNDGNF